MADLDWELPLPSISPLQFQPVADTLLMHGNFNLVNGVSCGSLAAVPRQEQLLRNGFE